MAFWTSGFGDGKIDLLTYEEIFVYLFREVNNMSLVCNVVIIYPLERDKFQIFRQILSVSVLSVHGVMFW